MIANGPSGHTHGRAARIDSFAFLNPWEGSTSCAGLDVNQASFLPCNNTHLHFVVVRMVFRELILCASFHSVRVDDGRKKKVCSTRPTTKALFTNGLVSWCRLVAERIFPYIFNWRHESRLFHSDAICI